MGAFEPTSAGKDANALAGEELDDVVVELVLDLGDSSPQAVNVEGGLDCLQAHGRGCP